MASNQRFSQTYSQRAEQTTNSLAKQLFELMERKQTNLCLAADKTNAERFLWLADAIGPEICVLKTHIDIVENFTPAITDTLTSLAKKHNFLIFEDRKFADIGNTVTMQFQQGVYRIADWAHLINAHVVPGPGIIEGLQSVAAQINEPRGLLLLAQMSSQGNLATDQYTKQAVHMAEQYPDFVVGFIGNGGDVNELKKLATSAPPQFIIMTPGVKLSGGADALKQQYTTPADVISAGSDIVIVGRGIYGADDLLAAAKQYRRDGWQAYQQKIRK